MRKKDSSGRPAWHFGGLVAIVAAALILATTGSRADVSSEPISGLQIENAVVTTAPKGGTALAGFRLENLSGRSVTLVGVRSSRAASAAIMIRPGSVDAEVATAVAIREEEILDLRSSHLWIELRDLTERIVPGEIVPFELVFATGTVRVEAHAHAGAIKGKR